MTRAVVLVGHGSRIAAANREFLRLAEEVAAHLAIHTEPAFVELAEPSLPQALAAAARKSAEEGNGVSEVVVAPVILFAAGHVKSDIPLHIDAARKNFPTVRFREAAPLGVHRLMVELVIDRIEQSRAIGNVTDPSNVAVIILGRGSSDPDANSELYKLSRLVFEGCRYLAVENAFCGVTPPDLPEALRRAARLRPKQIVIVPYLFFAGVLLERARDEAEAFRSRFPWIEVRLADPIGRDPRVVTLISERVHEAIDGLTNMSCDLCKYKVRLSGFEDEVGGEKALLRSLRHASLSAAPAESHAHAPIRKHLLVCINTECVNQGSAALLAALRQKLKDRALDLTIQTTKTSCLRRCGDGPLLVVYPDGIWYRSLKIADLDEIIEQHLCGNRPVARLMDQILTI